MLVRKFIADTTISHQGKALDIGFGQGKDALILAQAGYSVEAIDKSEQAVEKFTESAKEAGVSLFTEDVCDLVLDEDTYSLIVASNVLFFINDKKKILELIDSFLEGLSAGGYLLFSLLGPKDAWKDKPNMSFFKYDEIIGFLNMKGIEFYFRSTEEGYGPMMSGEIKYWHLYRFIIKKK